MVAQVDLHALVANLATRGLTVATAESLTAGGVAHQLSQVPGASAVLSGGVVAYTEQTKHSLLHVPSTVLATHGPVSGATAIAMARGAQDVCGSTLGVSTTGVAGPTAHGGKPVGRVWIAVSTPDGIAVQRHDFSGSREQVVESTIRAAFRLLIAIVNARDINI